MFWTMHWGAKLGTIFMAVKIYDFCATTDDYLNLVRLQNIY